MVICSYRLPPTSGTDGESLAAGEMKNSQNDIGFLLSYAKKLPYVDWMNTAFIGHSLGGQTANYTAVQGNMPFDAYVCMETTQEYHIDKSDLWTWVSYALNEKMY